MALLVPRDTTTLDEASCHYAAELRHLGLKLVHEIDMVPALGGEETGDDDVGVADDIARTLKCMARPWPAIPTGTRARMPPAIHVLTIGRRSMCSR
jgi:hypothetical protein